MKTIEIDGKTFVETFDAETITGWIQNVANQINHDYEGTDPLFVGILNGAFIFAADLFRRITLNSRIQFMRLRSYDNMSSTGQIQELLGLEDKDVAGKDIIIVEDIVDTGTTMHYLKQRLKDQGAKSVKIACLCTKPEALKFEDAKPDYVGKDIANLFVIGYGFDIDGLARNLNAIYTLKK